MKKMFVALCSAVLFAGCSISYDYEVKGTAKSATISYTSESGSISQETDAQLPWKRSSKGNLGDIVSISAQNNGETGDLVVEIVKEGKVFKSGEATGAFGVATAAGSL